MRSCLQVVHTYSERMSYRPWRRVFVYDRGQCGSTDDIMAASSEHAVRTIDIARGTVLLYFVTSLPRCCDAPCFFFYSF